MAKIIAGMTMSLDGFAADRNGSANPLYPDLADLQDTEYMRSLQAIVGAVLMGRGSFEMGDSDTYADNYELQVPLFILTRHPPARQPKENERLTFTFLEGDLAAAAEQAKAAAGDRDVLVVGGPVLIQQLLRAGLVDELRADVMPVFLGEGKRYLENVDPETHLEKIEAYEVGQRTCLRFRVLK